MSFFLVLTNLALLAGIRSLRETLEPSIGIRRIGAAAATLGLVGLYGAYDLSSWRDRKAPATTRVTLVQAEIPASWSGRLARAPEVVRRLSERTREAVHEDSALVVWPENALGFLAEANPRQLSRVGKMLPAGSHLLLGSPQTVANGREGTTLRNSALLLDEAGDVIETYSKTRLTPFAEYWPALLPAPEGAMADTYVPGSSSEPLDWTGGRLGTLICWEAIYPDLGASRVRAGAQILVNIANDAWFAGTPAIEQHFAAASLRAVETRRFLLRASNHGVSAIVTPWGEIRARGESSPSGAVSAEVYAIDEQSAYTRTGDWFAWLCVIVTAVGVVRRRSRRTTDPPGRDDLTHPPSPR